MATEFEQIQPNLYKRQYQTADGQWRTLYYGRFKCRLKRQRRLFSLGDDLKVARDELKVLQARNIRREDFDKEKEEQRQAATAGMTVSEWLDKYLELVKSSPSWKTRKSQVVPLKRLLGALKLSEVNRVRIIEYKNRRMAEPLTRQENPVEGSKITGATANREVSCLVTALNLAADEGLCDGAPKVKKEHEFPRNRILTDEEYKALRAVSPRWLERVMICGNEAGLDRGGILGLTWDCYKDGLISVKGGREKTKAMQRVGVSPELEAVLEELRAEYRRTPNTERRVFTKDGKPIAVWTLRHAFDKAVSDAKVEGFILKDFRHCARTRWLSNGLPYEIAEIGLGHKLPRMAGIYANPTDDHIRRPFREMFERIVATRWQHEKNEKASNVEQAV